MIFKFYRNELKSVRRWRKKINVFINIEMYCSIKEAWGKDFLQEREQPKKRKKKKSSEPIYYEEINHKDTQDFSRSTDRLAEHSGPQNHHVFPNSLEHSGAKFQDYTIPFEDHPVEKTQEFAEPPPHEEIDTIKQNLEIMSDKLERLFERMDNCNKNEGGTAHYVGNTVIYLATGLFTLCLLDIFVKKRPV
jgi:hypothetical protein